MEVSVPIKCKLIIICNNSKLPTYYLIDLNISHQTFITEKEKTKY
jgi:hypothetical protein